MASSTSSWQKSPLVVGATQVAASVLLALGVVSYTVGDTRQVGDQTVVGIVYSSGGMLPLYGEFSNSGQLAIQNPYPFKIKCGAPTLHVTTSASPLSTVDINYATAPGIPANASGSLFDNWTVSTTGLTTASGSAVTTADGQQYFLLDENGGSYDYIYSRGVTGTGQHLVAKFHADCYPLAQ